MRREAHEKQWRLGTTSRDEYELALPVHEAHEERSRHERSAAGGRVTVLLAEV